MARRLLAPLLALALASVWLVATAVPAVAACHIAGFVETDVPASPDAGVASLTVELQGRVGSCAGTVDVTTVDGSAVAGEDYEAVASTLTFEENDDRVETVDVTILPDASVGDLFTLELSNPTGDISGTSDPATITIVGDGEPATEAEDESAEDESAEDQPVEDQPAEEEPAEEEPAEEEPADEPTDDQGIGGGTISIAVAVLAALVIGGGAFAVLRGRG